MKLEEVLPALRAGKKIRRQHWHNCYYSDVVLKEDAEIPISYWLCNDWEIVEEPKCLNTRHDHLYDKGAKIIFELIFNRNGNDEHELLIQNKNEHVFLCFEHNEMDPGNLIACFDEEQLKKLRKLIEYTPKPKCELCEGHKEINITPIGVSRLSEEWFSKVIDCPECCK